MAALIIGASLLIKQSRTKRREKKLWRESSYRELERETQVRLADEEARSNKRGQNQSHTGSQMEAQSGPQMGDATAASERSRGRNSNNPFFSSAADSAEATAAGRDRDGGRRARSSSSQRSVAGESVQRTRREPGKDKDRDKEKKKDIDRSAPIGQSAQWWEEKRRQYK